MADRFDRTEARRPAAPGAPRRDDMAGLAEDDPLLELARIVSGNESFDEILGGRQPAAEPARAAPPVGRAQPPRDTSFDLESELMSDLHASFDPVPRPPQPQSQTQPRVAAPGIAAARVEPRVTAPSRADEYDRPPVRPAAPARPAPSAPSPDPYVAAPDFGRGRMPESAQRRPAAPPAPPVRDDDDYGDDYVDDDDLRADDDFGDDGYDDGPFEPEPPRRSRKALITAGVVLAVLVVGGVAAYAIKGRSSVSGGTPQVIAADQSPTKVEPAVQPTENQDAQQNKLIYDRADPDKSSPDQLQVPSDDAVDDAAQANESQASRDISRIILPGGPGDQSTGAPATGGNAPAADNADDSGPRKVRTVVVKPDGTIVSSEAAPRGAASNTAAPQVVADNPPVVDPAPTADTPPAGAAPAPDAGASDPSTPAKDASQLAPPDTAAATQPMPSPAPAADTAPAPAPATSGGFVVQVTSQRTEAQASAAYKNLQKKFPSVLGDRSPDIAKADLGAKGIYYRARVGPMATRDEAVNFCEQLRAAGGTCIVQKN